MKTELERLKTRLFHDSSVKNVKFYPGESRERGPEAWARDVNAFISSAEVDGLKPIDLESELDE